MLLAELFGGNGYQYHQKPSKEIKFAILNILKVVDAYHRVCFLMFSFLSTKSLRMYCGLSDTI
jgi:hypothetical protein